MTRKLTALVLCAMAVMGLASGASASYWDEGHNGMTEADAYIIDSAEDMTELWYRVNEGNEPSGRYYKLTQNITLSNWHKGDVTYSDSSIGNSERRAFTGHFNGNGNTITFSGSNNLFGWIDSDGVAVKYLNVKGAISWNTSYNTIYRGGIAARLKSGTIENCNFDGSIYITDASNGYVVVGGIAGEVKIDGAIRNCRVSGDLTAGHRNRSNTCYAGGIAGRLSGGTIEKCRVTINDAIYAYSDGPGGQTSSKSCAGGIAGDVSGSTSKITNCVVKGTVRSKEYTGGIVGYMQGGTLANCYVLSDSAVEGNYSAGGIAGYLGGDATADSNWIVLDSQVSAAEHSAGGIVGYLNSGAVTNNRAYTRIQGRVQYKGAIIGYAQGSPNTWSNNYYNADSGASYAIGYNNSIKSGSSEGGTSHSAETTTVVDPVDPDPLNPSPFTNSEPAQTITITITKSSLAGGTVGLYYSDTLTASTSGVTWSVSSGTLPAGLTLNPSTGAITGTPAAAGTYTFTITASTAQSSAVKDFTITVNAAQTNSNTVISIRNTELFSGIVGTPYRAEFVGVTTGTAELTWSVISGSLPDGLSLRESGIITGTPTKAGEFTFTVQATDGIASDVKEFTILIEAGSSGTGELTQTLSVLTTSLPEGTVGTSYSATLRANISGVSWRVSSGRLPSGLTLNASTGTISGTPAAAGTNTVEITAEYGNETVTATFTIVVKNASVSLVITTNTLPGATVGSEYRATITANMSPVSWGIEGSLPPGLRFDTSTGELYGVPASSGNYSFSVSAAQGAQSTSKVFTLIVSSASHDDTGESSGGGGCNMSFGVWMVLLSGAVLMLEHRK